MSEKANDEEEKKNESNKDENVKKDGAEKKKDSESGGNVSDENNDKLPSAKLLLSVAQKENDYEIDRKKTFETRSAVFVAFTGVLITLITKIIESKYFDNVQPAEFISYAIKFGLFLLLPSILLIVAVYCFLYVMIPRSYVRFDLEGFEKQTAKLPEEQSALFLMEKYRDVVNTNSIVNTRKSVYFRIGVITIGVAALLVGVMTFIVFV
ncbi:hypothetical protein NQ117_16575 [Paenibacillus sp. SC116]|uniref:hypothetical protein n=1 Tax=Paenibacillus sp. SC116 TaxID=2968986 RepID=UPI00215AB4BE|nr:hypothetical protein [Paenibacillus sp. SC116]MCR8845301.1 hypothetical protein [Paenibacillus sp. SC116]